MHKLKISWYCILFPEYYNLVGWFPKFDFSGDLDVMEASGENHEDLTSYAVT
jgi:hypothetical protein